MTKKEQAILKMIEQGILKVNPDGTIWRVKKKHKEYAGYKPCTPRQLDRVTRAGYVRIGTRDIDGNTVNVFAHRIVWMYSKGDISEGLQINHKNGVKDDNRIKNLELVTASEQMVHAVNVLGRKVGNRTNKPRHWKLSTDDILSILRLLSEGLTPSQVADKFNVSGARIYQIRRKGGR